jgi:hypothetical protein
MKESVIDKVKFITAKLSSDALKWVTWQYVTGNNTFEFYVKENTLIKTMTYEEISNVNTKKKAHSKWAINAK